MSLSEESVRLNPPIFLYLFHYTKHAKEHVFSLVILMSCYLVKQTSLNFFVKVTMLQTIWIERTPKQLNDNQFLRISRMFHPYLSNAWHSKIHFNLFSQEHDNGSHMQFTWKLVWFWQQKIQFIKGSNDSNFLFTQTLSLELAVIENENLTMKKERVNYI